MMTKSCENQSAIEWLRTADCGLRNSMHSNVPIGTSPNPRPKKRNLKSGAVLAEFALLLPLYTIFILGTFYLGYSAIVGQRSREASAYIAQKPGTQSQGQALSLHLNKFEGTITHYDEKESTSRELSPRGIYESIVEGSVIVYGHYVMRGGQIYYELRQHQRWPYRHLLKYNEIVSELLSDYLMNASCEFNFKYAPDYLGIRDVGLPPLEIPSAHGAYTPLRRSRRIEGNPHPVVQKIADWRGDAPHMPDFEPTDPFWAPQ